MKQNSLLLSITFHSSNDVWSSDLLLVKLFISPSSSTEDMILMQWDMIKSTIWFKICNP